MAGCAVPSGFMFGIGMAVVKVGMLIPEVVALGSVTSRLVPEAAARFAFELVAGVGTRKEMKKGVFSPSKGGTIPSVVLPKKACSSNSGAAGDGGNAALVKESRAISRLFAHKLAADAPEAAFLALIFEVEEELS